jgi:lysophospholipid acyltransferase (LPLAT)-like uncharacterized protein
MSSARPLKPSQRLALAVLPPVLGLALRGLASSWRVRSCIPAASQPRGAAKPLIYAMWHECVITVTGHWRDHAIQGLASQSFDGSLIARTLLRLGYPEPSRGSSSRGGADAIRSHVEALRQGRHVVVTMDGPRGPAYAAKPGVLRMAQDTGALVVPVACATGLRWRLKSWDRTLLPPPFARVGFALGDPLRLEPGAQGMLTLQSAMSEVQLVANALMSR